MVNYEDLHFHGYLTQSTKFLTSPASGFKMRGRII